MIPRIWALTGMAVALAAMPSVLEIRAAWRDPEHRPLIVGWAALIGVLYLAAVRKTT